MIPCELYLSHILIKLHLYEWEPLADAQVNSIDLLNFLQDRPTLFIVFHVVFIINLFCVSAEKSCNFGDVHRAPSSHPNLETKLKCDENKMARQWDVYSLDPVNIPTPRPQIHLHPHSLLYTYVSPNWVNRPTNNVSKIWKKYHSVPSIALHKLRQLVHNGLGRVLRYLQGGGREGRSRTFAFWLIDEVQPYQRRSPSALDFRFPPLLFRANQGPWNCALWLYSFSFESWRPDTRIGDNNNCSTSKWLCNTSHLRIIRIRILEKWAKYEHHPSFKAGHSFFFCYFARFFFTPGTFSQDFVSLMLFTPLPLH